MQAKLDDGYIASTVQRNLPPFVFAAQRGSPFAGQRVVTVWSLSRQRGDCFSGFFFFLEDPSSSIFIGIAWWCRPKFRYCRSRLVPSVGFATTIKKLLCAVTFKWGSRAGITVVSRFDPRVHYFSSDHGRAGSVTIWWAGRL